MRETRWFWVFKESFLLNWKYLMWNCSLSMLVQPSHLAAKQDENRKGEKRTIKAKWNFLSISDSFSPMEQMCKYRISILDSFFFFVCIRFYLTRIELWPITGKKQFICLWSQNINLFPFNLSITDESFYVYCFQQKSNN